MEKPQMTQSGGNKGKGKFTTIINIQNIAMNIHRDASEICRYMSKKFSVGLVQKESRSYSFTGHISNERIMLALKDYIFKFVLCQNKTCNNPETEYVVEHNKLCLKCASCGQVTPVADQQLQFTKSIVKQLQQSKEKIQKISIFDIKKSIKEILDQQEPPEKLQAYIETLLEEGQLIPEEIPVAVLSVLKIKEEEDLNNLVTVINKQYLKIDQDILPNFKYLLFTLEIIYFKNKQLFSQNPELIQNLFFSDYIHFKECDPEETFVTEEIHNQCLQDLKPFYERLNQILSGEEEEEYEEEETQEMEILM